MRPEYSNLFSMDDPLATRPMRLSNEADPRFKIGEFDDFVHSLFRGERQAEPPLCLRAYRGGQPVEVIWSAYPPITVVSQRVVDLFRNQGFTGWATYTVEVRDKTGKVLPGYHGLAVTGRTGERDLSRVEVSSRLLHPLGKPQTILTGFYFEDDSWDGSDFCVVGSTIRIVVTGRVVEFFRRAKIRNVEFVRLPEVETPSDVYEIMKKWPLPPKSETGSQGAGVSNPCD